MPAMHMNMAVNHEVTDQLVDFYAERPRGGAGLTSVGYATVDEIKKIIEDFGQAALRVKKAGYDAVEVLSATGYLISQFLSEVTNKRTDEYGGSFDNRMRFGLDVMRAIKEAVDVPVVASHRINDPDLAREMIGDGLCDMVALGRSLIADPYLPEKARTGREGEIVHCIACAQGCFDNLFKLKPVECLCDPRAGHERETQVAKARDPKKVMVIGGGAAGTGRVPAAR